MWSPEMDTLDQLQGSPLAVFVVKKIFDDEDRFHRALTAMLTNGEVRLITKDDQAVPRWRWREVLSSDEPGARFAITEVGAKRIR
jgi:hypothetical protein